MSMNNPSQGEIWIVDFNPTRGQEIQKQRPAVVVSNNAIGQLALRIVVPVTDWKVKYSGFPWFTELKPSPSNGLSKHSGADSFQVKSLSTTRFNKKIGHVSASELENILAAIEICISR